VVFPLPVPLLADPKRVTIPC